MPLAAFIFFLYNEFLFVSGAMLRVNPQNAILFIKSGSEMVGTVEITNIHTYPVTYKVS